MSDHTVDQGETQKAVIEKLLQRLELSFGIVVDGRDQLLAAADSPDWKSELTRLLQQGRKVGAGLRRGEAARPAEDELRSLLAYFYFTDDQIKTWSRNLGA